MTCNILWCTILYLYYEEGGTPRKILWGEARGISWWFRLYFIVFPDSSHNTDIFNYKSSIDLPGRSIQVEFILRIALAAGQYGKILASRLSNIGELNFNTIMFSNWECISIRTRGEIYGQIYSSAWRSSRGQSPRGYIWPYIPSRVLIRTLYHFNNYYANVYFIILIDNYSVYSLGSVLCNIPLAPRKYWRVWFQYFIVKNDIMNNKNSNLHKCISVSALAALQCPNCSVLTGLWFNCHKIRDFIGKLNRMLTEPLICKEY